MWQKKKVIEKLLYSNFRKSIEYNLHCLNRTLQIERQKYKGHYENKTLHEEGLGILKRTNII